MTALVLDISRTLSRAAHPVPTGIDRVEMAYAEGLLARAHERLDFAALHPLGRFGTLPKPAACRFLAMAAERWRAGGGSAEAVARAARGLRGSVLLRGDRPLGRYSAGSAAYLLMSHHHLHRPGTIVPALRRRRAAFVCMVHDLIPLEYPEYARPAEPARHRRRIQSVVALADGIVVNSAATARSLAPWLAQAGRTTPVLVAPLGVDPSGPVAPADGAPYFVFLGTIEPRKNHLLALHVWRRLAERGGPVPKLILIGRRGWENEQVVDLVERCAVLRGHVEERGDLSDAQVRRLVAGARALILPSFAEGYGLPVAEALALGTPVLASDLPALREVGGDAAEYLDPLDGPAWLRAIEEYAQPGSARRAAQLARLQAWSAPGWDAHLAQVLAFVDEVARALAI